MATPKKPRTLYEKILDDHIVCERDDGTLLLYIDRHLIHEVTSPQAFLSLPNRRLPTPHNTVPRPHLTLATSDHNVPTTPRPRNQPLKTSSYVSRPSALNQISLLSRSTKHHSIPYLNLNSPYQGIVHVIGPELGFTLPGTTVVCGDSHTSTHGAFGALAYGIGTSEVEHVLATQTIVGTRWGNMKVRVEGELADGVTSKDLMLCVIGKIGTAGGTGMVIEFCGPGITSLPMEARMTLCNMSIEAGARAGLIAPDNTTIEYLKNRPLVPSQSTPDWKAATQYWASLYSDEGAHFDKEVIIDARDVVPSITWGTSPEQVIPITGVIPSPSSFTDPIKRASADQALKYMALEPGTPISAIKVDKVFIGSCTNARLSDIKLAAKLLQPHPSSPIHRVHPSIKLALIVPGSTAVKVAAEKLGLDKIFKAAGFEWREAGCSLCVGLNEDSLDVGERCVSTSNRNFESRQGTGGRTHLVGVEVAVGTAVLGKVGVLQSAGDVDAGEWVAKGGAKVGVGYENHTEAVMDEDRDSDGSYISDADSDDDSDGSSPATSISSTSPSSSPNMSSKPLSTPPIPTPTPKTSPYTTTLHGPIAHIPRANIDTDALFPKQFITTTSRTGLGSALFYNLRFTPSGEVIPSFPLNSPPFSTPDGIPNLDGKPRFLLAGENFGCGSSREHAVWALQGFGITAVIAPSFADIFFNNSFKNGLLLISLPSQAIDKLAVVAEKGKEIIIDVPAQQIRAEDDEVLARFDMDPRRKKEVMEGGDEVDRGIGDFSKVLEWEERRRKEGRGWIERCTMDWAKDMVERRKRGRGSREKLGRSGGGKGLDW